MHNQTRESWAILAAVVDWPWLSGVSWWFARFAKVGAHPSSLRNVMAGPAALQVLYLVGSDRGSRTGVSCPERAAWSSQRVLAHVAAFTAHNRQHNGKTYPSSSTTCLAVSVLFGLTPAFSLPGLQHRMKRRRRLERMEQALQTTNRKTDHEFIQDFLLMSESLQIPEL